MTTTCYKDYTVKVVSSAQAYWAMESADPLAQDNSLGGPQLVKFSGVNAHFTTQPGLIAQCEQIHNLGPTFDAMATADDPAFKFSGNGFTLAGWVNFTLVAPMLGVSTFGFSYDFDQNGINYNSSLINQGAGNWTATFNGFSWINQPAAPGWHFLVLTYNAATGILSFDIDQAGAGFAAVGVLPAGPNVSGVVQLAVSLVTPGEEVIAQYDELGLYNRVLSAAQLNYLYNGGAGRTWPITLP